MTSAGFFCPPLADPRRFAAIAADKLSADTASMGSHGDFNHFPGRAPLLIDAFAGDCAASHAVHSGRGAGGRPAVLHSPRPTSERGTLTVIADHTAAGGAI